MSSCLPPDKAGQATGDCRLQAAADGTGPDQLKDLHRLRESLDGKRPQGIDLHRALHQPQGGGRQPNAARRGELLHARRQVRGLAHGGVVHVQVVANGAHHHFAGVEPDPDAAPPGRGCGASLRYSRRMAACMARAA